MKNKFNTTGFWLSLTGAIIIVLQQFGEIFNFNVNSALINNIVNSICGVLVVIGILIPTKNNEKIKKINEQVNKDDYINNDNEKKDNE